MAVHEIILRDEFRFCSYVPDTLLHSPELHQLHRATLRTLKTKRTNKKKHTYKKAHLEEQSSKINLLGFLILKAADIFVGFEINETKRQKFLFEGEQ